VLIAGGNNGAAIASAELYDVGLGFSAEWQPQIISAAFDANGRLVLTAPLPRHLQRIGWQRVAGFADELRCGAITTAGNEQTIFCRPNRRRFLRHRLHLDAGPGIPGFARCDGLCQRNSEQHLRSIGQVLSFTRDTDGDGTERRL
jgi:hypothetical protein